MAYGFEQDEAHGLYKDREFSYDEIVAIEDAAFSIYYENATGKALDLVETAKEYGKEKIIEIFFTKVFKGKGLPELKALDFLCDWVESEKEERFAEHWKFIDSTRLPLL
ncbi:hypothetical protein CLTEP_25710 [Clostridium tepidiprofundi DSM 19306]|uniref:Uncharacterized protein n=1 Tax=Clostridium tepidiprofundi DSM 19306 TaxID=1121338 RepID=A0A151ASM3_9CLOT|nr:hypothetical protein [Clostridium tepidiprofundi]KYH30580.1 hypothetical protein CLTEP_25710 [Clostridium tepidiprofundi DSM 19306]